MFSREFCGENVFFYFYTIPQGSIRPSGTSGEMTPVPSAQTPSYRQCPTVPSAQLAVPNTQSPVHISDAQCPLPNIQCPFRCPFSVPNTQCPFPVPSAHFQCPLPICSTECLFPVPSAQPPSYRPGGLIEPCYSSRYSKLLVLWCFMHVDPKKTRFFQTLRKSRPWVWKCSERVIFLAETLEMIISHLLPKYVYLTPNVHGDMLMYFWTQWWKIKYFIFRKSNTLKIQKPANDFAMSIKGGKWTFILGAEVQVIQKISFFQFWVLSLQWSLNMTVIWGVFSFGIPVRSKKKNDTLSIFQYFQNLLSDCSQFFLEWCTHISFLARSKHIQIHQ